MAIASAQGFGAFPSVVAATAAGTVLVSASDDESGGTHSRVRAPHVVAGLPPGLDTFASLAHCFGRLTEDFRRAPLPFLEPRQLFLRCLLMARIFLLCLEEAFLEVAYLLADGILGFREALVRFCYFRLMVGDLVLVSRAPGR